MNRLNRLYQTLIVRVLQPDRGASMVEYALLIVLIALIAFAAVQLAGNQLSDTYSTIADAFPTGGSTPGS